MPQMSLAYSAMVRSEENLPEFAVYRMDLRTGHDNRSFTMWTSMM
jgi:hypothetical protein